MKNEDEYIDPPFFQDKKEESKNDQPQKDSSREEYTNRIDRDENRNYPPKPIEAKKERSLNGSIISLIIFIALFHFVFHWEFLDILFIAFVLIIHELGHYFAMKYFKYSDLSIFFIPLLGAITSGNKQEVSQKQNAIILLAGPVPGIIFGFILLFISMKTNVAYLSTASSIFIYINIFNLLPIIPLDGGRLLSNLFLDSSKKLKYLFVIFSIIGLTTYAFVSGSYMLIMVAIFMLFSLKNDARNEEFKTHLKSKSFTTDTTYDELQNRDYWLMRDELSFFDKSFRNSITPGMYDYSDNERPIYTRIKSVVNREPINDIGSIGKFFFMVFWVVMILSPILFGFLIALLN